jgi:hypothetical protein
MKALFFLAALAIVGLVVTGAISLHKSGDTISIEIDKQEVAEDARAVIKEGKEIFHKAESSIDSDAARK